MRIFLTGGTGFIGGEVTRQLRARGDEVVALVRDKAKAASLVSAGCELVQGDLGDVYVIRKAMEGVDAVIHGAAMYEVGIPAKAHARMHDANVTGTTNVLQAALDAGVGKVVYISTVAAFGHTDGAVVDETVGHSGRYGSYYDETKHEAHGVAQRFIEDGLPCVIVQPGAVYGPGDTSQVGNVMSQFMKGRLPMLAFPDLGLTMVHRDDVAAGVLRALDSGRSGEAYVLGGDVTTMRGFIETLATVAGRKVPRFTMPTAVIKAVAPLGPVIGPLLGYPPNMRELVRTSDGVTYWARDDKARAELGYAPRGLEQGLRDTLAAQGKLPE